MPGHDHCCVLDCKNRRTKRPELSFHCFPLAEPFCRKWMVAIKRDEGPMFNISGSTVACSEHFTSEDYTLPSRVEDSSSSRQRRRLMAGAVPSVFLLRPNKHSGSTPQKRRSDAEERIKAKIARSSLPKFGPMTKLESTEVEHTAARKRNAELENIVAALTAENVLLRSQVF